ncbi:MAG: DUF2066 domain-containing protein [Magnetovibrio sp.]|nr:DUF2066 domain-containing protein [Magnetovibrio sp.]
MTLGRISPLPVIAVLALVALALGSARAADVFEVRNVPVDVTAETAAKAREQAHARGEAEAFRRLLERLTLEEDRDRLPELTTEEITTYVSDFAVSDEKTSSVRYLAKLHVRFKPDPVRSFLRSLGVRFAETPSKPILVLPVYQSAGGSVLWEDSNPWRNAWNLRRAREGLVQLALPLGDLGDISAVNVQQAVRGDIDRLSGLALRYNAGDTIVAYARLGLNPGTVSRRVDVSVVRFSPHREPETDLLALSQQADESEEALLVRAADEVAVRIEDSWKRENLLSHDGEGITAVTVPITSLKDWLDVKERLGGVAIVRRLEVILLSLDEVRVNLHYVGAPGQLQTALGQADLALVREDEDWVLYPAGGQPPGKS